MGLLPTAKDAQRRRRPSFGRDARGATAVEFALVALPFLALVGGVFEMGIGAWAQATLQQAVTDSARQIYTGKFQLANAAEKDSAKLLTKFRELLCEEARQTGVVFFDCSTVQVSITKATKFADASFTSPSSGTGWNPNFSSYSCGGGGAYMVVQAAVEFPVFFTLYGPGAPMSGNKRLLQAAAVFKVEPYKNGPGGGTCS